MNICTECGHTWKSKHNLADTLCGCTCPHCGQELEVMRTRKRILKERAYFCVITTCSGFQVLRYFLCDALFRVGEKAEYSIYEVVQQWISPQGKSAVVARTRTMSPWYYDAWSRCSDMELRAGSDTPAYDIQPSAVYSCRRYIAELRRNGFNGHLRGMHPHRLFVALLTDPHAETLYKARQFQMLKHYLCVGAEHMNRYWASIKICIRNGYTIPDGSLWCDMVDLLRYFDKDVHNAKYICPRELYSEHDRLVNKRNVWWEREQRERRMAEARLHEAEYTEAKRAFFGLVITDGTLSIRVLESVAEFADEGAAMHHCVFANTYYLKKDALILSATIDGKRMETVEVSLQTFEVVQSRGINNSLTEHHDRIVSLVQDNMHLIRDRMAA